LAHVQPVTREILFYSDFPYGYHNREAEEKMARFAERGYVVHYVEQLGIRNPRPRHLARLLHRRRSGSASLPEPPFEVVTPKLMLPRRAPLIDGLNRAWLRRQLMSRVTNENDVIAWLRFPTPELAPLVADPQIRLVVYEVVDDHERGPGMTARLRRHYSRAEQRVLERADVVFAWSVPIRDRLAAQHPNVVLAPAAVDTEGFARAAAGAEPAPRTAVYSGSMDFRFDAQLLAAGARLLPRWRFLVAGPADPDSARALATVPNVTLLGTLPFGDIPSLLAGAAVCLMPYRRTAYTENLFPVKLVEYLAAGRPVVSTSLLAARELAAHVRLADDAEAFAEAVERAGADDGPAAREARMARAERYSWSRRIDEMESAIEDALVDA
jgi:UDP-galactopyranose mutase